MWTLASLTLWLSTASLFARAATPYLTAINSTQWFLSNGDSFDLTLNSEGYAYSIQWNGRELVRNATGGYVDYGGRNTINITSQPEIITQTDDQIHVAFDSYYATVHYILFANLPGHYQYVVNKNLGVQGEIRSLWRLDPVIFTKGRTNCRDDVLPTIGQIQAGVNVQDETWIRQDGGYITKYDFSCFVRSLDYHGVYGDGVGAWIIAPGKDYYIGDHMKQELMVHRETKTNDAVMLHYFHGTHYMSDFANTIPDGKLWGPWLFYVNDGDMSDVANRVQQEDSQWPYAWLNNTQYQTRATVKGRLVLSDGRTAAGAAVFLGDENGWETNNQGTYFQYTTYASDDGYFEFENVRTEKDYRLIAWSNGGQVIPDVEGVHNGTMVNMNATTSTKRDGGAVVDLGEVTWEIPQREVWWRIGDFDKKTIGFNGGGLPYQHGRSDITPSNLVYSIGTNKTSDWYFAQSGLGNWSVLFDPVPPEKSNTSATLTLQFAGFTSRSGFNPNDTTVSGLNVSMNYQFVKTIGSDRPSDKSLYRSATIAGAYYTQQLEIPSEMLKSDKFNRLDLSITATQRWRGVMWDALKLEWN